MISRWKMLLHSALAPHGKQAFIRKIPRGGKVLDLGCGNNSPMLVKIARPDIEYWGLDVGDYNNEQGKLYADHYILCKADEFAETIESIPVEFDAVISSHNIEHCNKPYDTLNAFCRKLRMGGLLYLAFPSEDSVHFPQRSGTLNFYDDKTHIFLPEYKDILDRLGENGVDVKFAKHNYRPLLLRIVGGYLNP